MGKWGTWYVDAGGWMAVLVGVHSVSIGQVTRKCCFPPVKSGAGKPDEWVRHCLRIRHVAGERYGRNYI